jgi:hypothetical protein
LKYYDCNLHIVRGFYYVIVSGKVPEVNKHHFLNFIFIKNVMTAIYKLRKILLCRCQWKKVIEGKLS